MSKSMLHLPILKALHTEFVLLAIFIAARAAKMMVIISVYGYTAAPRYIRHLCLQIQFCKSSSTELQPCGTLDVFYICQELFKSLSLSCYMVYRILFL